MIVRCRPNWVANRCPNAQLWAMSTAFEFCLPTKAIIVPDGPDWLHGSNTTATGYGWSATAARGLITRGGYNWAGRYP